ncbi:IclR family transcriptional regulator [Streptomyces sp. URMC 124]|uniref:IclR family transcriptional regulator n=1 Tax=Streptomyces sp. URMC 124 TaxID=3423405 RepID=UPI003F1C5D99
MTQGGEPRSTTGIEPVEPAAEGLPERSAVGRALRVLELACRGGRPRGLSEIAREAGVPKATTYRILTALCAHGMVSRWDGKYVPGERLAELASTRVAQRDQLSVLRATAMPFLLDLYGSLGGFVGLGVHEGRQVRYVERLHGRRLQSLVSGVGERVPVHSTAIGKLLLAFDRDAQSPARPHHEGLEAELAVIRHTGIAVGRQEGPSGMLTVTAPVLGPDHRVLAGLTIGDSKSRLVLNRAADELRRTAFALTVALRRPRTGPLPLAYGVIVSRRQGEPDEAGRGAGKDEWPR